MFTRGHRILTIAVFVAACGGDNSAPVIVPVPDQVAIVGEVLELRVVGSDPEGGPLAWVVEGLPATARAEPASEGLLLTWAPLASEAKAGGETYSVRVAARDGDGAEGHAEFTVVAYPSAGQPAFLTPPGFVLDLATTDRITFLVQVQDDDSAKIELDVVEDLPGARWIEIDDRTRGVTWAPAPEHIAQKSYWSLVVSAKDEAHPIVLHTIAVVLRNAAAPRECTGTWPPSDQLRVGVSADGGISVAGPVADPESPVRRVVLRWRTVDREGEEIALGSLPIAVEEGQVSGRVDGSVLGKTATLAHVTLNVRDDDDRDSTLCDHETRLPRAGEWTLALDPIACTDEASGAGGGVAPTLRAKPGVGLDVLVCPGTPRRVELPVGFDEAVEVTAYSPDGYSLSLSLAGEDPAVELASAEGFGSASISHERMNDPGPARFTVDLVDALGPSLIQLRASSSDSLCVPDGFEPDDDPASAGAFTSTAGLERTLCPGDVDSWVFEAPGGALIEATASFDLVDGDLDLAIVDWHTGFTIRLASDTTGGEHLRTVVDPGTWVLEARAAGAQGAIPYSIAMDIDLTDFCLEDTFAPNATASEAPIVPEGRLEGLMLCAGTEDHFAHVINAGEAYFVETSVFGVSTPMEVSLLDASGRSIQTESVGLTTGPLESGRYIIRLSSTLSHPARYALDFGVIGAADGCPADRFAPNDSPDQAPLLSVGWTTRATICPGELDHFAIRTEQARALRLVALYASPDQPVVLEQLDSFGVAIARSEDQGAWAALETVVREAGTHTFRVLSDRSATFYDLLVELP